MQPDSTLQFDLDIIGNKNDHSKWDLAGFSPEYAKIIASPVYYCSSCWYYYCYSHCL